VSASRWYSVLASRKIETFGDFNAAALVDCPQRYSGGHTLKYFLGVLIVLLGTSTLGAEREAAQGIPHIGFFIAVGYARLQSPDHAYIFGATNLPRQSVLMVTCSDFIGQGSHVVGEDRDVTVGATGLFQSSIRPKQPYEFKSNMVCSVAFHASGQPAAVQKMTGLHGEKLGTPSINSQVGIYSGGQYLEAVTVLHS
jgi:hypothetical protein